MAGVSDQGELPRFDPRQIGVGKVGDQQRRVMHAGFDRAEHIRITGQRGTRQHDRFAVDRVVVRTLGRKAGDLVTHCQIIDTVADSGDHTGHLVTKTGQAVAPETRPDSDARGCHTS